MLGSKKRINIFLTCWSAESSVLHENSDTVWPIERIASPWSVAAAHAHLIRDAPTASVVPFKGRHCVTSCCIKGLLIRWNKGFPK